MNILLAVDGSPYSKKMLAYLASHDKTFHGDNHYAVLNVQLALPARARAVVGKDAVNAYYAEEAQKVLQPVAKFLKRHGIEAGTEWRVGHPAQVIADLAYKGGYDMVIMGSHGHGALANLVMGSVATQVLAQCKVPLLLVR